MRRISNRLFAGAVGSAVVAAAAMGVQAQGLVTIQKLSAPLANELVGEAVVGTVGNHEGEGVGPSGPRRWRATESGGAIAVILEGHAGR